MRRGEPVVLKAPPAAPAPAHEAIGTQAVRVGRTPHVLPRVLEPLVSLALWRRSGSPALRHWLEGLPASSFAACRARLHLDEVAPCLEEACRAQGLGVSLGRDAFVADVADLARRFVALTGGDHLQLRLEAVHHDACRRWHRDCVSLRLITTYRGPGTQWVPPACSEATLARADDEAPEARSLAPFEVAVFKGCGHPDRPQHGGVVHRSPRLAAGSGGSAEAGRWLLVLSPL